MFASYRLVLNNCLSCVAFGLLVTILAAIWPSNAVHGQVNAKPRNLGAPSPAEMLVRLQYRQQQETPLFDLLRKSGQDIFSKLGDDERKFAERFAEDLIQNRGMDSEEVQELMRRMDVQPDVQKAIRESLKRNRSESGGVASADLNRGERNSEIKSRPQNFDIDRLKRRIENARNKNLLDRLSSSNQPPATRRSPAERPTASGTRKRASELDSQIENRTERLKNEIAANGDNNRASQLPNDSQGQPSKFAPNSGLPSRDDPRSKSTLENRRQPPFVKENVDASQPSEFQKRGNGETKGGKPTERKFSPAENRNSSRLLNSSQRQVVEKLQKSIGANTTSGRETRQSLEKLKQAKDPTEFLDELSRLSKQVKANKRKQELLADAAKELSRSDENLLRSVVEPFSPDLAKSIRGQDQPFKNSSESPETSGESRSAFAGETPEDWAENEFLKKAISYYNDEESGFEKPKGFDGLLNGGKKSSSPRSTLNLEAAKKLWDKGSDIFKDKIDESVSDRRAKGIKPGQRIDQSVMEAIKKVSTEGPNSNSENKSMFSKALNGLIGTAMGKAEENVKEKIERSRGNQPAGLGGQNQFQSSPNANLGWQPNTGLGSNPLANNVPSSNTSNATSTASSSAATISSMAPNFTTVLFWLLAILAVVAAIYFAVRSLQPSDAVAVKKRELQKMLQSTDAAKPSDIVEAVDLLLLTKFGSVASWWNSHRAAERLQKVKPAWREKIVSIFQVYRRSRYQSSSNCTVPTDQKSLVTSALRELADEPQSVFEEVLAASQSSRGAESAKKAPPSTQDEAIL